MSRGCVCTSSIAVAPYDSDDEALEAYERDVSTRVPEPDISKEMSQSAHLQSTVDAYGFELRLTPESKRARARNAASAERRASRWRAYRDDVTETAMLDARTRRLSKKSSVDTKLTGLIRKGVPRDLRRRVWMSVSGAASSRAAAPQGHYERVVRDAKVFLEASSMDSKPNAKPNAKRPKKNAKDTTFSSETIADASSSFPHLKPFADQIDLDIPRTFPENSRYHGVSESDSGGRSFVRNVLLAYAAEHPEVGYCQGMNYVAAFLWLVVSSENAERTLRSESATRAEGVSTSEGPSTSGDRGEDGENIETPMSDVHDANDDEEITYWLFTTLLDSILEADVYASNVAGTVREFRVLRACLKTKLPKLQRHLTKTEIDLCMIQSKWLLCVFTESFPSETTARVLDVLFAEGFKVWFRVITAVLKMNATALSTVKNIPDAMLRLSDAFKHQHDADVLLKLAFSGGGGAKAGVFPRRSKLARWRTEAVAEIAKEAEADKRAREKRREAREAQLERAARERKAREEAERIAREEAERIAKEAKKGGKKRR